MVKIPECPEDIDPGNWITALMIGKLEDDGWRQTRFSEEFGYELGSRYTEWHPVITKFFYPSD